MATTDAFLPAPALPRGAGEAPFTGEEAAEAQARLWALLRRQTALKTQGDSASLPEEEAAELLDSVVYTLKLYLEARGLPLRTLLTENPHALLAAAQQTVRDRLLETGRLYRTALRTVRTFGSRSLADTLAGIAGFFKAYDDRLYAHRVPADIDYPLCRPVPDSLRGVTWLQEYLNRLLLENELLCRFSPARVAALLTRARPEYGDLIVNLYEPVAADVTGLSLLGCGETLLELTPAQAERIAGRMRALAPAAARSLLRSAAVDAGRRLGLSGPCAAYLAETAETLYPRIVAGETSADGVFAVRGGPVP